MLRKYLSFSLLYSWNLPPAFWVEDGSFFSWMNHSLFKRVSRYFEGCLSRTCSHYFINFCVRMTCIHFDSLPLVSLLLVLLEYCCNQASSHRICLNWPSKGEHIWIISDCHELSSYQVRCIDKCPSVSKCCWCCFCYWMFYLYWSIFPSSNIIIALKNPK